MLNLLCLDAPLVAVAWQWLFASTLHANISNASRGALFLTAWLIYLIDRFVDSISSPPKTANSARQKFCSAHRYTWIGLMSLVAVTDLLVVIMRLDPTLVRRGFILGAVALAYLSLNFRCGRLWQTVPIKEICVGLLFAGGTLLALAEAFRGARWTIDFAAALFAALCTLNCISIAFWERDLDLAQHRNSMATRWPNAKFPGKIALVFIAIAAVLISIFDAQLFRLTFCLGLSALSLFALDYLPLNRDARTASADLVLLTPLLLFVVENIA